MKVCKCQHAGDLFIAEQRGKAHAREKKSERGGGYGRRPLVPRVVVTTGQPVSSTAAFSVQRQFLPSVTVKALQVWHNGRLSQLCWQNATELTVASPVRAPPGNVVFAMILLKFTNLLPGL